MADSKDDEQQRRRGRIRKRGNALEIRVCSGDDLVPAGRPTSRRLSGAGCAAQQAAEKKATEFLSQDDK